MSSPSLRLLRALCALLICGSALLLTPGRPAAAYVCTPPIFQGWINSCQGLQIRWLNQIPSYLIDHYEIYYETRYDLPSTPTSLLAYLPGSAISYSDLSGCGLYAIYIIKQINKDGSSCQTRTITAGGGVPHSFPCDDRCLGGAAIALNQTAPPTVAAGANLTYTITANNYGPNDIQNIQVTDNLPGETTFVSCGATGTGSCGGSGNSRTVSFSSIASGATETITLVAQVNPAVAQGTVITNTVTAAPSSSGPITVSTTVTNTTPCTTSINPSGQSFSAAGGGGSIGVIANCGWSATSAAGWITITSPASGSGNGTINYSVAANTSTSSRQGTINVSGQTYTVTQSGDGGGTLPTITTSSLPGGQVGVFYSQSLNATGGTPPYNWFFTSIGTLPPGLNLNANGTLMGTPTTAGAYSFTAGLSDSLSLTAQKSISITIANATPTPPGGQISTAGVYRPSDGVFYLRSSNTGGYADLTIPYGIPGDYPVTGDWNGDGIDTIGVYRGGTFLLHNSNTVGGTDLIFSFGQAGDLPVAGDWDGDGVTTIGVYRQGLFLLRNSLTPGPADWAFSFGGAGDLPVIGDWDGNRTETIGLYRPASSSFWLRNSNSGGAAELEVVYGAPGDLPLVGDWDGDGVTTVGIYRQGLVALRNTNTGGYAEVAFLLGGSGDLPLAGRWR